MLTKLLFVCAILALVTLLSATGNLIAYFLTKKTVKRLPRQISGVMPTTG